jgi:hypothetical protein
MTGVTVAIDHGFVRHLRAGRVRVVSPLIRFERDEAVLADGRRLRPDVVVAEACGKPRFQNYGSATARLRRDLAQVATGWGP